MDKFFAKAIVLMFLVGCKTAMEPPPQSTPPIEVALNNLGVDTTASARISNEGVELPESFSPFGRRIKMIRLPSGEAVRGSFHEMVLAGFALENRNSFFSIIDNLHVPVDSNLVNPNVVFDQNEEQAPWARETPGPESQAPLTLRDMAAADLNSDGLDELVIAHLDAGQVVIRVVSLHDRTIPDRLFPVGAPASVLPPADIRIVAGNFDLDAPSEIVLAVSGQASPGKATPTSLMIFDDVQTELAELRAFELFSARAGMTNTVIILAGNIDYDVVDELVVIVNEIEITSSNGIPNHAGTEFKMLDDAEADFRLLRQGTPMVQNDESTFIAQVSDAAIGDIDADQINEVILGGLSGLTTAKSCNEQPDPSQQGDRLRYLLVLYEFNGTSIEQSAGAVSNQSDLLYPSTCADDGPWAIRFLEVNTLDIDGDSIAEIQANQYIFRGLPPEEFGWDQFAVHRLSDRVLFPDGSNDRLVFDRHSARMISSDANGDGRDDIVSFRAGNPEVEVFGYNTDFEFTRLARIPVEVEDDHFGTRAGQAVNPILMSFDADLNSESDVQIMEFVGHSVTFTEPIVLAALAAAPCGAGIGQNTDACTTEWGTKPGNQRRGRTGAQVQGGCHCRVRG